MSPRGSTATVLDLGGVGWQTRGGATRALALRTCARASFVSPNSHSYSCAPATLARTWHTSSTHARARQVNYTLDRLDSGAVWWWCFRWNGALVGQSSGALPVWIFLRLRFSGFIYTCTHTICALVFAPAAADVDADAERMPTMCNEVRTLARAHASLERAWPMRVRITLRAGEAECAYFSPNKPHGPGARRVRVFDKWHG